MNCCNAMQERKNSLCKQYEKAYFILPIHRISVNDVQAWMYVLQATEATLVNCRRCT